MQKAEKLICQCVRVSDEPIVLLDLSLTIYLPFEIKKKPLLSRLSIESSPGNKECRMTTVALQHMRQGLNVHVSSLALYKACTTSRSTFGTGCVWLDVGMLVDG